MSQLWHGGDQAPPHLVTIISTAHWRKGPGYYARCTCVWRSRFTKIRALAVDAGDVHTRAMAAARYERG